ncbi:ATP-binding protein [Psychrobacter glacincola]|uniref:Histidine kinase/DNA gyrase B/HSP90-like ATPase n=1 Tax=Psychrobacter immobilis TaxID=498 RepID=A0A2V2A6D3_PSYIM|nr:ATP-binding protein [Psychrobacter immobilis]PWK15276.1 histidine kinase/DNA gyrase B/HSP90-like ATPase [Psychrobacter immobilis]
MAKHDVQLVATKGVFMGLAKQNMLFHQCISELVDNAVASTQPSKKFRVEIIFQPVDNNKIGVYVVDNGLGMSLEILEEALQLGRTPSPDSDRLHEHGFGLKNSLATLTRGDGYWKIWTKQPEGKISSVEGPFGPTMQLEDNDQFPDNDFLPAEISTLVYAETTLEYIRTVQGRGGPTNDLIKLRRWLIEHLGVFYRGYLELDKSTGDNQGTIQVSIEKDRMRVPPVHVPFGRSEIKYFEVEFGSKVYKVEYEYGTLDEVKCESLVSNNKNQYYYLNNIPTQGIDIRLGKRVLATSMFDHIWKTKNGTSQLNRHNTYNDFVGELRIPNIPRGFLTTVNNKTDFNLDDQGWNKIFEQLNNFPPPKDVRQETEKELKQKWIDMIKATTPEDDVTDEYSVWSSGVKIDVYREKADGNVIIYELKVGDAQPIHLYQLIMYWDGLELQEIIPTEAILLVVNYSTRIEDMVNKINSKLITPLGNSYNIRVEKHSDRNL